MKENFNNDVIFNTKGFIYEMTNQKEILGKNTRLLLENSFFYYCSGNDPSPIFAFGAKFPLYIYVDSYIFMRENYTDASEWLYKKLIELKFILKEKYTLESNGRFKKCETKEIQLTLWEDYKHDKFYLLYIQADAIKTCSNLFKYNYGYILPKCVCNYRYELSKEYTILDTIEKKVPFIFGYAYGNNYKSIGQYPYIGNFGGSDQIILFKKKT